VSKKKPQPDQKLSALLSADNGFLAGLFILLIAIVPLLVRIKVSDFTAPRIISSALDTGVHGELFVYYQWLLVIMAAAAALIILLHKMWARGYTLPPSYMNVPLLLLTVLVLLSLWAAQYKSIALLGIYSQREGALLTLAYLALGFTAANTVYKPWFSRGVNAALLIFTVVNTILILAHFFGYDLLQAAFLRDLVAPPALRTSLTGELGTTLANPNYLSGFAAALFAYFMVGTLMYQAWRERLPAMLASVLAFVIILACLSSSGFVTVVLVSPLLVAVAWRSADHKRALMAAGGVLAACLLLFIVMNNFNHEVRAETVGFIAQLQKAESPPPDREGQRAPSVTSAEEQDEFQLPDKGWGTGTGRLYIWEETLKLIQVRPWLGYGPDTLVYYFPQNDVNKVSNLNKYSTLITKPHSMYLGIAFGMGIPALLALLALFLLHIYYTARNLWRASASQSLVFPAAVFLFFCAFVLQGIFNDLVVSSGAVFWTLLGAGIALNRAPAPPGAARN
jgi:hypothetical protein